MAHNPGYFAYLLRVWNVGKPGEDIWRASLEDPHTGEQKSFLSLEDLMAYLVSMAKNRPALETEEARPPQKKLPARFP